MLLIFLSAKLTLLLNSSWSWMFSWSQANSRCDINSGHHTPAKSEANTIFFLFLIQINELFIFLAWKYTLQSVLRRCTRAGASVYIRCFLELFCGGAVLYSTNKMAGVRSLKVSYSTKEGAHFRNTVAVAPDSVHDLSAVLLPLPPIADSHEFVEK